MLWFDRLEIINEFINVIKYFIIYKLFMEKAMQIFLPWSFLINTHFNFDIKIVSLAYMPVPKSDSTTGIMKWHWHL